MDKKIFNGILQYTQDQFGEIEKKPGYIYLVRSSESENDGDAEIWFGTRRYGSVDISSLNERNISAVDTEDVFDDVLNDVYLKYVAQYLTDEQKEQALTNIGAVKAVEGKQLSSEDFTSALKSKLEGLEPYDDSDIQTALSELSNNKQDIIEDIDTIRDGATLGATALQYTPQVLSDDEQAQARVNINAMEKGNIFCGTF